MKNPCPARRSLGFERVGQGYAKTVRYLNREPGDFVVAIADVFSFRDDWHKLDQVNPLVRQYQHALDAILSERPDLAVCAVNCCHCGIRFLTDPRNAGRWNLRCPFGCRQARRRQQSNERSRAYYQTDSGRRKKKRLNGKRGQAVARRQQPDIASSRNLDTQGDQRPVNPDADADSDTQKSVSVDRVPHRELSPPREKGTLSFGGVVLDETTLVNSPILSYACMLASLLEGRTIGRDELVSALLRTMRQHSMGRRVRREYVLQYLKQHPP